VIVLLTWFMLVVFIRHLTIVSASGAPQSGQLCETPCLWWMT
jgi:hypothetical protein